MAINLVFLNTDISFPISLMPISMIISVFQSTVGFSLFLLYEFKCCIFLVLIFGEEITAL